MLASRLPLRSARARAGATTATQEEHGRATSSRGFVVAALAAARGAGRGRAQRRRRSPRAGPFAPAHRVAQRRAVLSREDRPRAAEPGARTLFMAGPQPRRARAVVVCLARAPEA